MCWVPGGESQEEATDGEEEPRKSRRRFDRFSLRRTQPAPFSVDVLMMFSVSVAGTERLKSFS